MDGKLDVVLPAGGRLEGTFAAEAGTDVKALISVGGATLLERTIGALRATGRVERVAVVGPSQLRDHPAVRGADAVLPEGASGPENVLRGLEWLRRPSRAGTRPALVATTDLPFLTPEAVLRFLDACPVGPEIVLPVVRREHYEERFPGSPNTYVALRDGEWTLGCLFRVCPDVMEDSRTHVERVFAARKSQFAMARLLGAAFVLRFLCRRLGVPDIERRCGEILGCAGAAVPSASAELAFDIDTLEHLKYARAAFRPGVDTPASPGTTRTSS